ncbi:predicted protein [Postia placenta Mad-698-R]|nr:predicted protein [Postia placenta Mad-698-R]
MRKDLGKTWADAYYEKSAGGVQVYPDWAAFATALEEAFPEHGTRIKAHQILMKLLERQKNKKTALSLGNYVTRFEQLASKAQLKDAEVNGVNRTENDYHTLHANFVKGLPKELYVSLATRVARDRPSTMKAWYDEVRNADAAEQGALTVTDTRDYGKPMDIDAAAGRKPVLLLPHQGPQRQGLPQESGRTTRGWEAEPGRIWEGRLPCQNQGTLR